MNKKVMLLIILVIITSIFLSGCMPGDGACDPSDEAGFFSGIWHGWIAPISLVFGLFDKNIRIYEVYNRGWLYDFGFYIALIGGFGGFNLVRNKKKK
ncbi:hypothetical protein [Abyssisolibacter fermentans]|uniref:hypothetical protein n=1 Tax=Abyssisolibacter fermentans TaxID=1766203 RepID=UPI00082DFCFB|nr:hypothetical protein [Abyssisolibacter fermentans]